MYTNHNKTKTINRITDHPVYGSVYVFDNEDLISRKVRSGKAWESDIVSHMRRMYIPNTDFIDVGANLGLNTLLLHLQLSGGITGHVHCFEPQADVFAMLSHNVCRIPKRSLYNFALGDTPRILSFTQDHNNVGATTLQPVGHAMTHVVSMPLDALQLTNPISLIKVDVEGSEIPFLRGARETLIRHQPNLLMEVFHPNMTEVLSILREIDYERKSDDLGESNYIFGPRTDNRIE